MKKALIVWGGWDGHKPKEGADLFSEWLRSKDFEVEVSDNLDSYLDAEKLSGLSLIVPMWTMGTITEDQRKGLCEAIKSGVGLAGYHGLPAITEEMKGAHGIYHARIRYSQDLPGMWTFS